MTLLTDKQIISKYKMKSSDKILDIGGSMKQHEELGVDTLVDVIHPEDAPYGASKLKAKRFVKLDVTKEKLPFKSKKFDFCLCTHILEDLSTPFLVIEEMQRVAKRGLIITPSMGHDMVYSHVDFTNWLTGARRVPGQAHHKWFFVKEGENLKIMPRNYPILYTSKFHITGWDGDEEMIYYWEDKINYKEILGLSIHELIKEYERYIKRNEKHIKKGRMLFFIDNPLYFLKGYLKLLLKKGKGYKYKK